MRDLAGFWSYAHVDNENSGGRVISLSARVEEGFQLLSGDPLQLFTDREIAWGEEWESRIDEELERTTFLIPIITPSYFRQEYCRRELLQFASAAKQFDVEQLLLPVYYVTVPELETDDLPTDEAMAIIKRTQWADARDVRLADESSAYHRAFVDQMAQRLVAIADQTEARSARSSIVVGGASGSDSKGSGADADGNGEDGYLDLLAKGEEALPRWVQTVTGISEALNEVGAVTKTSVAEMESDKGGSFASRLAVANRFARRLSGPAEKLVALGSDYVSQLFEVDPAIRTMLRLAREQPDSRGSKEFKEFATVTASLADSSRDSMREAETLSSILGQNARFSRELRQPLQQIDGALRNMVDAQSILDEWSSEIADLLGQDDQEE